MHKLQSETLKGRSVVMIKHSSDTRYTREHLTASHDQLFMISLVAHDLTEDPTGISEDVGIIGVDEGQFFKGLFDFCQRWNDRGVSVFIAACNTTASRQPFGGSEIPRLISWGCTIKQRYAICIRCGSERATLTKAIETIPNEIHVGGAETYGPVCVSCFDCDITREHLERREKNEKQMKKLFK
jgi:thymidine kinase